VPAYFLDTSALVKFYVHESGSDWVRSLTDSDENLIYVVSLARVETISALTRRLHRGDITKAEFDPAFNEAEADFVNQFRVVELTRAIIDDAAILARKHGLRAYDAVQLAAAQDTNKIVSKVTSTQLTLVSADIELNAAAVWEGLQLENPNNR
jgi:predicted nucleic acid-binding protein